MTQERLEELLIEEFSSCIDQDTILASKAMDAINKYINEQAEMQRPQVGDRVRMINNTDCDNNLPEIGSVGTVVLEREYSDSRDMLVKWDSSHESFHHGEGLCNMGHGWWVPYYSCEVI